MTVKFQAMSNDDLEMVVGGAAWIFKHDMGNGKYDLVVSNISINAGQAAAIYNCKSTNLADMAKAAGIDLKKYPTLDMKISRGLLHGNYARYRNNQSNQYGGIGGEGNF